MAETQPSKETTPMSEIVPIAIEKSVHRKNRPRLR